MNAVKSPSNVKNAILAFIRNLVTKTLYKAISILLNPCCTIVITSAEYDCGAEEFIIKISPRQPLLGKATVKVFSENNGFIGDGVFSDNGGTITVSTSTNPSGLDEVYMAEIFLPTDSESLQGVYQIATGTFSVPAC